MLSAVDGPQGPSVAAMHGPGGPSIAAALVPGDWLWGHHWLCDSAAT